MAQPMVAGRNDGARCGLAAQAEQIRSVAKRLGDWPGVCCFTRHWHAAAGNRGPGPTWPTNCTQGKSARSSKPVREDLRMTPAEDR